jgi:tRNA dimethylallyltransferase
MKQNNLNRLIVIGGPTAIGKTKVAIQLAQSLDTEIISADSRQIYQQLKIGVGRPSEQELNSVKHHLIGTVDIAQHYHTADFERDSLKILENIYHNHSDAIVCGGTGLYIKTLCDGIDEMPEINPEIRNSLNEQFEENGINFLQEFIQEKDPELVAQIDMNNPKRLIRAVEMMIQTGQPFSSFRIGKKVVRNFIPQMFCLYDEREIIKKNIEIRVSQMIENGWIDECIQLLPYRDIKALQTVGYKEIFNYLDGNMSLDETISWIIIHTNQYAKRQLVWFRKDKRYIWVKSTEEIIQHLNN